MRGLQAAGAMHTLSRRATEEKAARGCGGRRRPETLGLAMSGGRHGGERQAIQREATGAGDGTPGTVVIHKGPENAASAEGWPRVQDRAGPGCSGLPLPDLHLVDPASRSDRPDRAQPGGQEAPASCQSPDPGC